jgi:alkanesulfonate monooxygenase SsuD/methylene tetrahydromethanopterin reductase-like flavin-dependent oxidoreductase (luciferase family)
MRFGLQIETDWQVDAFGRMLAVARLAEELGFESVWYEDHFSLLECMSTLAALAASTRKVRLGVLVVGVPYRNPALIAKMWTTLDVISAGRAIAASARAGTNRSSMPMATSSATWASGWTPWRTPYVSPTG